QINKLPEIDEITLENKEEVEAVRKAYNNLTETQKALVSDEILEKLISAEEKINDLLNKEQEENNIEDENSSSKDKKDDKEKETLPRTGNNDDDNNKFYISGILLILLGLSIRRKIN